ncbi:GroES-like protein [Hyphopichia burtonii NRRL Y-1933]|uniref:GroES-like protein n=1 Tax=Hyphopichia burtonii NRRL Y-1933 TaxID=984485 RepID=A0A1E4RQV1_9ASCO|nr:GroES-like protein [Hyphopichia burtonii NRRL Y-1933]ODV69660.1 GroES-like protein [Hyphopichia burtonii NRRL Y-1933]
MKAIIYNGNRDIEYTTTHEIPKINHPTEVKIKIDYCGICGSDLHEYLDGPIFMAPEKNSITNAPSKGQIMGHEMSGTIVEVGDRVENLLIGQSVVVEALSSCNDKFRYNNQSSKCSACIDGIYNNCDEIAFNGLGLCDGGFSEYAIVGQEHVVPYDHTKIPASIAALAEPLSVSWHAVRSSGFNSNFQALVLGAGPIGLATILALKAQVDNLNQIVVMEPALARRKLAEKFGVTTFDPSSYSANDVDEIVTHLKKLSPDGFGFHRSFDCSGIPLTFNVALNALRTGGKTTQLAIWPNRPIDFYPMSVVLHSTSITGSLSYIRKDFEQVLEALSKNTIPLQDAKQLITAVVSIDKGIEKGWLELLANKNKHIKILITPKENMEMITSIQNKVE